VSQFYCLLIIEVFPHGRANFCLCVVIVVANDSAIARAIVHAVVGRSHGDVILCLKLFVCFRRAEL
jgi:hypothetical protein